MNKLEEFLAEEDAERRKNYVEVTQRGLDVGEAILDLIDAKQRLTKAYRDVPDYTGQHQPEDFYRVEWEEYEQACMRLTNLLDNKNG